MSFSTFLTTHNLSFVLYVFVTVQLRVHVVERFVVQVSVSVILPARFLAFPSTTRSVTDIME